MIRHTRLEHRFVKHVPEKLDAGVLYVSIEYASVVHSCCCGCGEEVVTPIAPAGWTLSYNGDSVSLWPSIGNWNLRCRSHYIIDAGRVIEALPWTSEQIEKGRRHDKTARAVHYGTEQRAESVTPSTVASSAPENTNGLRRRFSHWLSHLWK